MSIQSIPSGGAGGGMVMLEAHTAAASATLDFTAWYSANYDEYVIELVNLRPATDAVNILMQFSVDAGQNWDTGSNYSWAGHRASAGGSAQTGSGATTSFGLDVSGTMSNSATIGGFIGSIRLYSPGNGVFHPRIVGLCSSNDATANPDVVMKIAGSYLSATAVTGIRIKASSGALTSGIGRVYGIVKT